MNPVIWIYYMTFSAVSAALPPPQGKSLRLDQDYEVHDRPTSSLEPDTQSKPKDQSKIDLKPEESASLKSKQKSLRIKKARKTEVTVGIFDQNRVINPASNLPGYYSGIDRSQFKASDRVVFVPQNSLVKLATVKAGDIFHAVIEQQIKASPSVPTPIRAMVLSGRLKGGFFIGEATLDRELKRILISFNKVRSESGKTYAIKASGLSPLGSIGLEGEYHSQAGTFFIAELGAATAAGILDSTIQRNQTVLGNYTQEPSLSNTGKTGAITALSKSAERMAEAARQAPEYTEIEGFQPIKIIVQEDPTEAN